jgi:hypothetical protein
VSVLAEAGIRFLIVAAGLTAWWTSTLWRRNVRAVGVDFDGAIHAYSKGWHDGTIYDGPLPGASDALRKLMETYAVFIHTTRDVASVADWISDHTGIRTTNVNPAEFWNGRAEILVTNRKYPAVAYIDDRGTRFENWDQARWPT